jgi:uncharacterized protein
MKRMIAYLAIFLVIFATILALLYLLQEKLLFFPEKLPANYRFEFTETFSEEWVQTADGEKIHTLYFKTSNSRGCILYLHGNAGALNSWGDIATYYISMGYDIVIPDYRGFGKSTGKLKNEGQMYDDVQRVYDFVCGLYSQDKITVIGYSLGTGPATFLAANNKPCRLVLLAPYQNIPDIARYHYKIVPSFLLKYKFATNEMIGRVECPITLVHGKADEVIYYQSSQKLYLLCKPGDKLVLLENQAHAGINENPVFLQFLQGFLKE